MTGVSASDGSLPEEGQDAPATPRGKDFPAATLLGRLSRQGSRRLLLLAACLHLAATLSVYVAGRFILQGVAFDGDGVSKSFAPDTALYHTEAHHLARTLGEEGISRWWELPLPPHVKFFSLSYFMFRPVFGTTILNAELINLGFYLLILILVFKLGEEVFDRRVGFLAALAIALWPSFLLHTTQLLKDPLFIICVLWIVLVAARWLTRELSLLEGLRGGLLAGVAAFLIWINRSEMWEIVLALVIVSLLMLIVRLASERRVLTGNIISAAVLVVVSLSVPVLVKPHIVPLNVEVILARVPGEEPPAAIYIPPPGTSYPPAPVPAGKGPWVKMLTRLTDLRFRFATVYPDARSNIDEGVLFMTTADFLRYLPRAVLIGFCAPFPNMWLGKGGVVGQAGRMLGGFETLLMYLIELLAALSVWRNRRRLPVWLLVAMASVGVTALGLVIVNIGALFRLRYVFWMLLIILGADGALRLLDARRERVQSKLSV